MDNTVFYITHAVFWRVGMEMGVDAVISSRSLPERNQKDVYIFIYSDGDYNLNWIS